jgi:hypothetical protein
MKLRHTNRTLSTRAIPVWVITLEDKSEVHTLRFVRRMYRLR